ncbi:MAG: S41 family peptidase [Bacteroidales bacterium]|nr:S41 family peptidase [Bacteroidales bacterium]
MSKISFILVTLLLAVSCVDSNRQYVRKAVKIMDKQGIMATDSRWWEEYESAMDARPSSMEEAQEILRAAAKVAGGKHSFLQLAGSVIEDATSEWPAPEVTITEGGIPVVSLPPFSGNQAEGVKYASAVLQAIPEDIPGVVIDLRGNTGGNMYPMIAAVHRFLPNDGETLRFRTRKRTQWIPLSYAVQTAGVQQLSRIECPVAILTDDHTASSGEATLICFRGLDYVKVFGGPTAGYASANQPFPLPGGDRLVLTTGCDVARTGEVFCDDPIEPDVLTEKPLEDALEWITRSNQE